MNSSPLSTNEVPNPKFPKPRVMLIDIDQRIDQCLRDAGFNVTTATFGSPRQVERSDNPYPVDQSWADLPGHEEQELLIINTAIPECVEGGFIKVADGVEMLWQTAEQGEINARPLVSYGIQNTFDTILEHGGLAVVFLGAQYARTFIQGSMFGRINFRDTNTFEFSSELFRMTQAADSFEAWERLASAEDTIADQVLDEKPELFDGLAHVFIRRTPARTICRLIETKPEVRDRFNRQPDRDVQTVEDWVKRGYPAKAAIPRRRIVLDAIANQLSAGVSADQAFRFLGCIFAPEYKAFDQSPENFDTFIWRSGLLAPEDLQQMRELWYEVQDLLQRYTPIDWSFVVEAMRHWLWPAVGGTVNDEQREQLRLAATETLEPLCEIFANSPAAVSELRRLGEYHSIALSRPVPAEYATLFPKESVRGRTIEGHKKFEKQCYQRAVKLGNRWASTPASHVLSQLKSFNADANRTGHAYPNYSEVVCRTISQRLDRQATWISEAIRLKVPCLLLQPFLQTACMQKESGFEEILDECLKDDQYRPAAISILLHAEQMPGDLVKKAILASGPYAQMIYVAALRDEIASKYYGPLLSHSDSKLRAKVAEGLWGQSKTAPANPEVREKWRNAIAQDCRREHCVAEIFAADKEVCEQWIQYWSQGMSPIERVDFDEETIAAACAELSSEVRKAFLADLHRDSPIRDGLIRNLVSDDPDAFRQLLKQESLADYSLSPLRRLPDEAWVSLAQVAVSERISEDKIAKASGMGWNTDFDTVEDRYRAEILAWDRIIETEKGAISRIARRRRATRMESLREMED